MNNQGAKLNISEFNGNIFYTHIYQHYNFIRKVNHSYQTTLFPQTKAMQAFQPT